MKKIGALCVGFIVLLPTIILGIAVGITIYLVSPSVLATAGIILLGMIALMGIQPKWYEAVMDWAHKPNTDANK